MLEAKPPIFPITKQNAKANQLKASKQRKLNAAKRRADLANVYLADYEGFKACFITRTQFNLYRCLDLFDSIQWGRESATVLNGACAADRLASAIVKLHSVWSNLTGTPFMGTVRPEKMRKLLHDKVQAFKLEQPTTIQGAEQSPKTDTETASETAPKTDAPTMPNLTPNLEPNSQQECQQESPSEVNKESLLPEPEPVPTPATRPPDAAG